MTPGAQGLILSGRFARREIAFLRDWPLGEVKAGDLLAIWAAGAYGMSQASNYNARCRPAEVMVEGRSAQLIRRRETQKDLLRTDVLGG